MRAFLVNEIDDHLHCEVTDVQPVAQDPNDLLIRVHYSAINFKDAMVAAAGSRVRRLTPIVGGVDAAGVVERSVDPAIPPGTLVAVHGGDLGVGRNGGFAEFVYAPATFVSVLPTAISTRDAMIIGTAGLSAMASVLALEHHGFDAKGDVLVTGATGGVGSLAILLLAARGYKPVASTGSTSDADWLAELGAARVIARTEISDKPDRVLGSERWAGAVDCVGGDTLHQILRSLSYGAAVAACGLVAGAQLATNVYPFITRAVSLLGIDVVEARPPAREAMWTALGQLAPGIHFDHVTDREVSLEELGPVLESFMTNSSRGRILVNPTPG